MTAAVAQDSEQIWPGITDFGFDHVNAFMIFAPRPAAILATTYDFFPIEGARETLETAKRFYGMYGKEDNVRICEDQYTHSYTRKLAVMAAEFFTEVFLGQKITVTNDDIEVFHVWHCRKQKEKHVPKSGSKNKSTYGTIYRLCCDLMYLGDSMAAMHCYDVLRTIEMLGVEFGVKEEDITLYCEGIDGVYGIMAGFLNEQVHMEYGEGLLMNVEKQLLNQEVFEYDNTLAVVVPGMLKYFEYEDLLR